MVGCSDETQYTHTHTNNYHPRSISLKQTLCVRLSEWTLCCLSFKTRRQMIKKKRKEAEVMQNDYWLDYTVLICFGFFSSSCFDIQSSSSRNDRTSFVHICFEHQFWQEIEVLWFGTKIRYVQIGAVTVAWLIWDIRTHKTLSSLCKNST